jgi:hypothetical protein
MLDNVNFNRFWIISLENANTSFIEVSQMYQINIGESKNNLLLLSLMYVILCLYYKQIQMYSSLFHNY